MTPPEPAAPNRHAPLASLLRERAREVDARLKSLLPAPDRRPEKVHEAMVYATLAPGKRLRPVLTLTVAEMLGARRRSLASVLDLACAIEMVHACSLILDDMPMMDDAALRRGRPTTHRVFGDDVAVLASFGLLNLAFAVVAERAQALRLDRYTSEDLLHRLTEAVGSAGLIGGQALDLEGRGQSLDLDRLEFIHSHKTGALFCAAAELGAMAADARRRDLDAVSRYAKNLGLAFQITDDLLDVLATPEQTGKDSGQDSEKQTFVKLLGVDGARTLNDELLDFAVASLEPLGKRADPLRALAAIVRERER